MWKTVIGGAFCFSAMAAAPLNARQATVTCDAAEVRTVAVAHREAKDVPLDAKQGTIDTTSEPAAGSGGVTLLARGPVLGSMDGEGVATDVACTRDGVTLTATITRSAEYRGALRQNVNWFSELTAVIVPRRPDVVVNVVWKMKLSTGEELDRARTPPYPEQHYPITTTKTIPGPRVRQQPGARSFGVAE